MKAGETLTLYNKYSDYLKDKYGTKVYKLPVNLDVSCPNRDGTISTMGCYFCSPLGAGFESLDSSLSVEEQLKSNMAYISSKYNAKKFMAYFQNYTTTHMPLNKFENYMRKACIDNIVELVISTRPDCITAPYLDILKQIQIEYSVNISIELGLQTTNEETLRKINRGHGLQSYVDAVNLIHGYGFEICTHLILNLPWDESKDVVDAANLMNELCIEQVKLHSLYIAKGSVFEQMYKNNEITLGSKSDYINRTILFLEHLNPKIVLQRLIGRAPSDATIFCNWGTSWWKIHDEIIETMTQNNSNQGKLYIND